MSVYPIIGLGTQPLTAHGISQSNPSPFSQQSPKPPLQPLQMFICFLRLEHGLEKSK